MYFNLSLDSFRQFSIDFTGPIAVILRMKKFLISFFIAIPQLLPAQIDTVYVKRWDVVRGVDGVAYTFSAPARWRGKDWVKLGGVLAGTAAISLLDQPVQKFFKRNQSEFMDGFERVGYHYGKAYSGVTITGGLYIFGVVTKNDWAKETGLMIATGLTTSCILTGFMKNTLGRARPSAEVGNYDMEPFSQAVAYHSLPSGHASTAFTISMVMARQVKPLGVKILFYSLAGCTAVSRLYADAHWTSDVALGGTLAWFCADAAVKRLQINRFRKVIRQDPVIVKFYPYPGGLTLRASW